MIIVMLFYQNQIKRGFNMRIWVLPMAGAGTRTRALGHCKPAIFVLGRPILAWCLSGLRSLIIPGDRVVAITTHAFEKEFAIGQLIQDWLLKLSIEVEFKMVLVDDIPQGPAASIYAASSEFSVDNVTIVVNTDQFIQFSIPENLKHMDAFIPLYVNNSGKSSYVMLTDGLITSIVEKQLISCYASAGVYGFTSGCVLAETLSDSLSGPPHYKNEYFVGPSMNNLIASGGRIHPTTVIAKYDLGSVKGIHEFAFFVKGLIGI